jgi:transcriptional regulator with XRE-family HTH domain
MKRKISQKEIKRRERVARKRNSPMTPEILLERFSRYLSLRRRRSGMSLRQLAVACEMPFTNVFQYERNGKNPRLTELNRIAQAFNEPLVEFLSPLFSRREFPALAEKRVIAPRIEASDASESASVTVV